MEGENPTIERQVRPDFVDTNLDAVSDENQLDALFDQAGTEMATLRNRLNNQSLSEQNPDDQKRLHDLQAFSDLILDRRDLLRGQSQISKGLQAMDEMPRPQVVAEKNWDLEKLDKLSPQQVLQIIEEAKDRASSEIHALNAQKKEKMAQLDALNSEIADIDAKIAVWEKIMDGKSVDKASIQEEVANSGW
jgi:hypothetical protein